MKTVRVYSYANISGTCKFVCQRNNRLIVEKMIVNDFLRYLKLIKPQKKYFYFLYTLKLFLCGGRNLKSI